ncbi:MAG TPA: DUF4190 domain-containing protein [Tepidisphaeraceae bacterium]|nr:DUF4190 domain-containing protein [Tepidisphaeraceae bacterium]
MSQSVPPNSPQPYYAGTPGAGYSIPSRSTSAAAVASLVLGVLGCIPFVPGLLAVLFAVIGLRATRNPQVGGRGLAIAGLVLGLVSIAGWGSMGGIFGLGYIKSTPARAVARRFVTDMSTGNVAAASTAAPSIAPASLQTSSDVLKPLGVLTNFTFTSYNYNSSFGGNTVSLGGVGTFANGTKFFTFTLVGSGSSFTITSFSFQ